MMGAVRAGTVPVLRKGGGWWVGDGHPKQRTGGEDDGLKALEDRLDGDGGVDTGELQRRIGHVGVALIEGLEQQHEALADRVAPRRQGRGSPVSVRRAIQTPWPEQSRACTPAKHCVGREGSARCVGGGGRGKGQRTDA